LPLLRRSNIPQSEAAYDPEQRVGRVLFNPPSARGSADDVAAGRCGFFAALAIDQDTIGPAKSK
jgi:hypothetical protein